MPHLLHSDSEEEETRTPTSQLTLPPQSSASTNSATSPFCSLFEDYIVLGGDRHILNMSSGWLGVMPCFPIAIAKVLSFSELAKVWRGKVRG